MTAEGQPEGTVGKALAVLETVAERGEPIRFSDLLETSRYPKATLYRLVQTLTRQQMLRHDPQTGTYALGVRLVRLAHSAWAQSSLAPLARPHVDALSAATGETIHLAQLDRGQVLYVDKRNAARPIEMFAQAGKVGPAYCTGVGKAMLAFLDDEGLAEALKAQSFYRHTKHTITSEDALRAELAGIRELGYALDREEHELGIICCAVPVLSRTHRPLGAISLTTTVARATLAQLDEKAALLLETAARIAEDAESWRFPERT
ncbi:IclR family transcriptional regulator [Sulfitobacter sp. D35]|uniref:IclR family transcriptional regulator n=1 Tax=Sulfitobacter sp. D35 TaxID=3083252 RepID=UPI00296F871D|nr:IclR family transcriptional regulator [Sulfitobacter sp. D35]MDW4497987.1 IclR family transcriptional regulator [Sulfitobacter sp. D35]